MGGIEGARWQSDDQLHLTLRFIGTVDGNVAEDVAAALATIRHARLEIAIDGTGCFEKRGRIDTLWAGARASPALTELHHKLDRALVLLGLEPERRAYKPHVTLARFGRRGGDVRAFLAAHAALALPPWMASGFILFESHLGHERARYEAVADYPFSG